MSVLVWRALLVAWGRSACAEPPPPPPAVARLPGEHVEGFPLRFSFALPPGPGHTLRLYAALSKDTRACTGGLPGLCLHLVRPVLLAEAAVDASGVTRIEAPWPAALAGVGSFDLQAVAAYAARSRLDRPDTDGGGVLDGQEIMVVGTDPTDPADDHRIELSCDNGLDDDSDALLDCEDADCGVFCGETRCEDQLDDDGDGAVDCGDEECWTSSCLTHTLAWTVRGSASRGWMFGETMSFARYDAQVSGRIRMYRGAEVRTCTWGGGATGEADLPPMFRRAASVEWSRWFVPEGCEVGAEVLPPLDSLMWDGWYGPNLRWWRSEGLAPGIIHFIAEGGEAGPSFHAAPWLACPTGAPLVVAFPDADRDGYGVSEASDRHDGLGGRHLFCGSPLPGFVLAGRDCDDGDPTWSPDTVAIAAEAQGVDVEHDDRDADGVSSPVDGRLPPKWGPLRPMNQPLRALRSRRAWVVGVSFTRDRAPW